MKKNLSSTCLFLFIFTMSILVSCSKEDDINPFAPIANIATFHGNLDSDNVIIHVQGGPNAELDDDAIRNRISISNSASTLHVNVHQVQTLSPDIFSSSEISFAQTPDYHTQNVSNLKRVIDYFREQNNRIYIVGASFGGFLIQELISVHGIDIADGYAIFVSRLDIDEETWMAFSQGYYKRYYYDNEGNFSIENEINPPPVLNEFIRKNMAILAAGLGQHRYTEKLTDIQNLSKITYYYGDRDEAVGPLSSEELEFLNGKGAHVVLDEGGDHSSPVNLGIERLKEIFNIQ